MTNPVSALKVLIVAENASSRFGGEAFLPLKYFQILKRRGYDAKLITHVRNQDDLDVFFEDYTDDIQYVPDTVWHRIAWKCCSIFPAKVSEIVSDGLMKLAGAHAYSQLIRRLVREDKINLIHQPTPVSPKSPSAMHRFGLPLIIGPMNGGMNYPQGYEDYEGFLTRSFVKLARQSSVLANLIIPGKRRAKVLMVANARTRNALPFSDHSNVIEIVENGVDISTWKQPSSQKKLRSAFGPFQLIFIGRLIPLKAVDFTIRAVQLARKNGADIRFTIVGDGPDREKLEKLIKFCGLEDFVVFHGFLPQAECAKFLSQSDALILNSLHECGGAVVLEAMSMGLPVIAADWGGPADYLDEGSGILVPPSPREGFAERLSAAILKLADDPELCSSMGQAGLAKILEEYDWERKVTQMLEIYDQALKTH
ncbi:glycosyltransferase family 4 protein [Sedimentitalea sp.]|uniref:glycosyltransferase family 4 protein n=1 Tax=Sedimentitalea sp. TaxID=2048915 RepID=UPI0032980AD5